MALLRALFSILLFSHLVLGSEMLGYLEQQVSHYIIHDCGLIQPPKSLCPPWKYHKDNNSSCVCGRGIHDTVQCSEDSSTVLFLTCNCMSYSENGDSLVMRACPFLCTNQFYTKISIDTNLSKLCDSDILQNRQGQLCGQCKDNHSPSPYSYQLKCADCSHYKYNWLKYLMMAYAPLTVFFFVVIIFRVNALSASIAKYLHLFLPNHFLSSNNESLKHICAFL